MKEWQFDLLFFFALIGAIFLMVTPIFHIEVSPTSLTGYGAILTFVLYQKKILVKPKDRDKDASDPE